jgi:tRNA(Ile)-lysidine synthase
VGPRPAVAQVRLAVRGCLVRARLEPGDLVLVACSGGADSLALAAAVAFEAPRLGLSAGGVTVDHGLQAGSSEQAAKVVKALTALALDPVRSVDVTVMGRPGAASVAAPADAGDAISADGERGPDGAGGAGPADREGRLGGAGYPGPEAAARAARYRALDRAAAATGAAAILLGHTRDDQAETVLLGLARGSGARSLAGMPERNGRYLRPLLGISRAETRAACAAQNLEPWDDPQNADPGYARARVRHRLLPVLERELGPGVTEALARSADLLRADADFLDYLAQSASERIAGGGGDIAGGGGEGSPRGSTASAGPGLAIEELAALPAPIRSRVLRNAAIAAGCPPGALNAGHVAALDALVTGWHGQRGADLPGGIRGQRRYGKLTFSASQGEDEPSSIPRQASNREGAGGRD